MKSVAATVSPPRLDGGLAPEFEEKGLTLRRLQPSLEAFETSGNSVGAPSTGMSIEGHTEDLEIRLRTTP